MKTPQEHREHLEQTLRELILATKEDRVTHAIVQEYLTACENVARLDLWAEEYVDRRNVQ
jgi:hypothetical protein